jgi:predicted amidophosphoribosyltransferase
MILREECETCRKPVLSLEGVLSLDENGECDACANWVPDKCEDCGEPVVSPQGTIKLDGNGRCEECAEERREVVRGRREEQIRDITCGGDFDYSMNY